LEDLEDLEDLESLEDLEEQGESSPYRQTHQGEDTLYLFEDKSRQFQTLPQAMEEFVTIGVDHHVMMVITENLFSMSMEEFASSYYEGVLASQETPYASEVGILILMDMSQGELYIAEFGTNLFTSDEKEGLIQSVFALWESENHQQLLDTLCDVAQGILPEEDTPPDMELTREDIIE
ncbi:MAG: hypothetical protein R3Y07_10795, partial [Eubacteriales bacterium]